MCAELFPWTNTSSQQENIFFIAGGEVKSAQAKQIRVVDWLVIARAGKHLHKSNAEGVRVTLIVTTSERQLAQYHGQTIFSMMRHVS